MLRKCSLQICVNLIIQCQDAPPELGVFASVKKKVSISVAFENEELTTRSRVLSPGLLQGKSHKWGTRDSCTNVVTRTCAREQPQMMNSWLVHECCHQNLCKGTATNDELVTRARVLLLGLVQGNSHKWWTRDSSTSVVTRICAREQPQIMNSWLVHEFCYQDLCKGTNARKQPELIKVVKETEKDQKKSANVVVWHMPPLERNCILRKTVMCGVHHQ